MSRTGRAAGGAALPWRDELAQRLGSFLIWALVTLVARTCRVRLAAGGEHLERLRRDGGPSVIAFWHDRLFFASPFLSRRLIGGGYPLSVLISPSRDGELGARVGVRLGARVVRGSSSRGGREAVRGMLREAAEGRGLVVVPDGPKGPARRAKPGVIALARLARAPLVPLTWVADRSWRLGSWDRLEIPKPFARVAVAVGAPEEVPRGGGDEEADRRLAALEESLAALDRAAAAALELRG
ncbi:MAG TPA: lysophospholipid acyltransferase family protein [Thermoanaerobaculia bacterium]